MAKNTKYPKTIYVKKEYDKDDNWLIAEDDPALVDDGEVAIYELVGKKVKSTQVILK